MLAEPPGNDLGALCHEHHVQMRRHELGGKTHTRRPQTGAYACPLPDCTVHYHPSDGYFLITHGGKIELDSVPRVKCSVDDRPMYLAETNPQNRSFRLWKCPQCGATRTNEERVMGAWS